MQIWHKIKTDGILYTVCRMILGGMFIYASWDKIVDPAAFAEIIANYQIVSPGTGYVIAQFLPWFELVCGVCLVCDFWPQGSGFLTAVMMVVFMVALGYAIYHGLDISCGCFTLDGDAPDSMWFYMIRDLFFLVMAIFVVLHRRSGKPQNRPKPGPALKPGEAV